MVMIVNTTAAPISMTMETTYDKPDETGRRKVLKKGKMYNFIPSILTPVDDKDFEWLKKNRPLMSRSLELDDIIDGAQAKKLAARDEKERKRQESADQKRANEAEV